MTALDQIRPSLEHLSGADFAEVYEPAEDTFLFTDALDDEMHSLMKTPPSLGLEIGPGSGYISAFFLICWRRRAGISGPVSPFFVAADINSAACSATRRTSLANSTADKTDVIGCDAFAASSSGSLAWRQSRERKLGAQEEKEGDRLPRGKFDIILFNPPYVPTPPEEVKEGDAFSKSWAGGWDGREVIDKFIDNLKQIIAPDGVAYLLLERRNNVEEVVVNLAQRGFSCELVRDRKARNEYLSVHRIRFRTSLP